MQIMRRVVRIQRSLTFHPLLVQSHCTNAPLGVLYLPALGPLSHVQSKTEDIERKEQL